MLVGVRVFGRVAAGGDLELPHRETRRGVVGPDQAAHAAIDGPVRFDRRSLDLFVVRYFHKRPRITFVGWGDS